MALVSMRQLLDHAAEHSYGLPAFNVNNLEQMRAIMEAANQVNAPVIVQARRVPPHSRCHAPRPWRIARCVPTRHSARFQLCDDGRLFVGRRQNAFYL